MKKLLYILMFVPFVLFGQINDPCYSINDVLYQISADNPIIEIELQSGWNMIGYPCSEEVAAPDAFNSIVNSIVIVKDGDGNAYLPDWDYNGIGFLSGGKGYQIKITELIPEFSFCESIQLPILGGCDDCEAVNFNQLATYDNGSCLYDSDGDGINDFDEIMGCMSSASFNYDSLATDDDGSCYPFIYGCTNPSACNFISLTGNNNIDVNTDDGSCIIVDYICQSCSGEQDGTGVIINNDMDNDTYCDATDAFPNDPSEWADGDGDGLGDNADVLSGCTDITACNYNSSTTLNTDNTTCNYLDGICETCENGLITDNDDDDDGICNYDEFYCPYPEFFEYAINTTNYDPGLCQTLIIEGCTDSIFVEYNSLANLDNGTCNIIAVNGCTDSLFVEYNSSANLDNGSCNVYAVYGCTVPVYPNFNSEANVDDGSCDMNSTDVYGCNDISACNYSENTNINNGSCSYPPEYFNCNGEFLLNLGDEFLDDTQIVEKSFSINSYNGNKYIRVSKVTELSCEVVNGLSVIFNNNEMLSSSNYYITSPPFTFLDWYLDDFDPCSQYLVSEYSYVNSSSCQSNEISWNETAFMNNNICPFSNNYPAVLSTIYRFGCTDSLACNYGINIDFDDGTCIYLENGNVCDGNDSYVEIGDTFDGGVVYDISDNGFAWIYSESLYSVQSQSQAVDYCNNLIENSFSDWYLPNQDELLKISEFTSVSNLISSSNAYVSEVDFINNTYTFCNTGEIASSWIEGDVVYHGSNSVGVCVMPNVNCQDPYYYNTYCNRKAKCIRISDYRFSNN